MTIKAITAPSARTDHLPKTIGYYAAFIALGLVGASLGPTLGVLAEHTRTHLSEISFLFAARSLGYLMGSILGGRLYDRMPGHPVMAVALCVMALGMLIAPLISLLWILVAILLLLGLGEGLLDVGGNTLLVWVHRPNVGPYMNGLHFFFGLGALISPIVIAQLMLVSGDIIWGYWTLAFLLVPAAIWLARLPSPSGQLHASEEAPVATNYILVGMLTFFFFLFVGGEVSLSGWIYTYAVTMKLADTTTAAYLTSFFWGMFTLGRLVGIPIAARFRPRTILLIDLLGSVVSITILILWPQSAIALWLGVAGAGLAMASLFPVVISWAERRITITGFITSCFFVGTSCGAMFFPWFIGQLFESAGPSVTLFTISGTMILSLLMFVVLMRYGGQPQTVKTAAT